MDTYELLKEDLVQVALRHHTRVGAEVLANRVADLVVDMAKFIAEKAVEEHVTSYQHFIREAY